MHRKIIILLAAFGIMATGITIDAGGQKSVGVSSQANKRVPVITGTAVSIKPYVNIPEQTEDKPQIEVKVIERVPAETVTDEEKELMAKLITNEGLSEGYQGMRYICAVLLNRRNSSTFPNTILGVISQKNQFSVWPNLINKYKPTEEVYRAIEDELMERSDEKIVYFRTGHYHSYGTPAFKYKRHYFSTE